MVCYQLFFALFYHLYIVDAKVWLQQWKQMIITPWIILKLAYVL